MKASINTTYGPPEVCSIMQVDKPKPKKNELLVKVYAATVNRTDRGFRSAEYFISRFWSGLLKPKFHILGNEFAGTVEEIGESVTLFKNGDRVFGYNDATFGAHAEYCVIGEHEAVTMLPHNTDFYHAAPIFEGAHYALNNIRASKIQRGEHALVYGATGGIGSAAVQLLKHFGVRVTAVCGTKHLDLVRSLGADRVVDYQREDFTKTDERYHLVFDAVGKSSFGQCKPLMTENGSYVSTELGKNGENVFLALWTPLRGGKKVLFPIPVATKSDIEFLRSLVESGAFKPVIDREYTLDQIVDAYRYVETGQKVGNVVLRIA